MARRPFVIYRHFECALSNLSTNFLPGTFKTITVDDGSEFTAYDQLHKVTGFVRMDLTILDQSAHTEEKTSLCTADLATFSSGNCARICSASGWHTTSSVEKWPASSKLIPSALASRKTSCFTSAVRKVSHPFSTAWDSILPQEPPPTATLCTDFPLSAYRTQDA